MSNLASRIFSNHIVKSTLIYTAADNVNKAIPFLLLPVIARYLSPSDYGMLTNFGVVSQIFIAVCALNTYTQLSVSYHTVDNDNGLPSFLSNLIYLIGILTIVCLIFSTLFTNSIYQYTGISWFWQYLALFSAASTSVFNLYTSLLIMQKKAFLFSGVQIFQSLLSAVLVIVFVVYLQWNWQGKALSVVIAASASMLFSIWLMRKVKYLFKDVNINLMKDAFIFGLPLLPHTLSFWFKSGVDKLIITNQVGLAANGIYSMAFTLAAIISVFSGSFFNAYTPIMFKDLKFIDTLHGQEVDTIKQNLVKVTYIFACLSFLLCIISYFILKFAIPIFFPDKYHPVILLMPLQLFTIYFNGMYSIMSGYIFYRQRTKILGLITFVSSLLQIVLTYIFVHFYGIMGALYSSSIVSVLVFGVIFWYSNSMYKLPWGLKSVHA